ncbi:hypothetical protein [Luteolibacter sp. Populi]|uniref:hypothetical protein n=1 Tax=Luteolibacter sp. Populi TaxID=3230487 RepID=UPI003465CE03
MKKRLFLIAALLVPILRAEPAVAPAPLEKPPEEKKEQFIRVTEEKKKPTALQTAVVRLSKGDASVELIGAIHIADKKYYAALNQRFTGYDALLWEGIGGGQAPVVEVDVPEQPKTIEERVAAAEDEMAKASEEKKGGKLDGLHQAYEAAAEYLDLSYQMMEIDYSKPNFVHADLSMQEFSDLQEQRGESLLGFMFKAGMQANKLKPVKEPSALKLLISVIKGDKAGLKRELVHTLGAGDDQVAILAGESVIISDRNAKCLEVLAREVKGGKKKLGIFYGAAHFPDMVKRLADQGWTIAGSEWMTAWDIPE